MQVEAVDPRTLLVDLDLSPLEKVSSKKSPTIISRSDRYLLAPPATVRAANALVHVINLSDIGHFQRPTSDVRRTTIEEGCCPWWHMRPGLPTLRS